MFGETKAFSGFSVDDLDAAMEFYRDKLGLAVTEENGSLTMRLVADRNYNFNFVDKESKMSMFSSSVWYHGRNENESEHFYRDQDEAAWPVSSLTTSKNGVVSEAVLLSGNHEVGLRRIIRMYDDCEAITSRYGLSALQSREYPSINFPIVRFSKEVDSVSFNTDPDLETFGQSSMPTEVFSNLRAI